MKGLRAAWRRRVVWLTIATVFLVALFVQSNVAIGGSGQTSLFNGWVTVLTTTDQVSTSSRFRLQVTPLSGGARPSIGYNVAVCGRGPQNGWLLIGGDARLQNPQVTPENQALITIPSIDLLRPTGDTVRLGEVQAMRFEAENPPDCIPIEDNPPDGSFLGTGFNVRGQLTTAIATSTRALPFSSPRFTQALPLTGGIIGIPRNEGGAFELKALDSSELLIPPSLVSIVDAGELDITALIEAARPTVTAEPGVRWISRSGVHPIVSYITPSKVSYLNAWSNGSALFAGITGGLLLATLVEGGQPRRKEDPLAEPTSILSVNDPHLRIRDILLTILVIGCAHLRRARRHK